MVEAEWRTLIPRLKAEPTRVNPPTGSSLRGACLIPMCYSVPDGICDASRFLRIPKDSIEVI